MRAAARSLRADGYVDCSNRLTRPVRQRGCNPRANPILQLTGNLSTAERAISALGGIVLAVATLRRASAATQALTGTAAAGLLARAWAGHCGVQSALQGHTSFAGGLADQWDRMFSDPRRGAASLPVSPAPSANSDAVDQAADQSFRRVIRLQLGYLVRGHRRRNGLAVLATSVVRPGMLTARERLSRSSACRPSLA